MSGLQDLNKGARVYVSVVVACGGAVLVAALTRAHASSLDRQWLILAGLTLLSGSFSVKVPSINAYISVSEIFVIASVLLFGADAGTATVLLECLVILFWMRPRPHRAYRILFNIAAPSIAIWISGQIFFYISGSVPYSHLASTPPSLPALFVPLTIFTTLYFLLNSGLVAIAVSLENAKSPLTVWWRNFAWLSVNYFSGASVAALIVTYTRRVELSTLIIIVPLLVISYTTFRTAMGRAEDSFAHVTQLNRLYLSTIETLAMAIDAKDQITHGHIRRVQEYAVGLAKHIGISEERLIKAIEAAALLHDMGKLAVPEYILNKPGKLTVAEFEKMKLHASVGADILAAIEFPYPVVPIVRHHHENWDGTGYPTGLRGTEIPIGARILSVVDCFDALTSDRPYRAKLHDGAAIDILLSRRGSMYDPMIVDAFIRVYQDLSQSTATADFPRHALRRIAGAAQASSSSEIRRVTPSESTSATDTGVDAAVSGVAVSVMTASLDQLSKIVPFTHALAFVYDVQNDFIELRWHSGWPGDTAFRLQLGERLSGWVAANRKTVINSDPRLDMGDIADTLHLRSTLSVPVGDDALIGVLTLYSNESEAFTERHARIVEKFARDAGHFLERLPNVATVS
jgi:putative nucleotidyltransferase with HDIG domain